MSQNSCCVPGCLVTRKDGVPLHRFPNPDTNAEKFKSWISNIGGEVATLDHLTIYGNRRVCRKHFEDIYKYPKDRLCKLAIPVLHIPEQQLTQGTITTPASASTSSVKTQSHSLISGNFSSTSVEFTQVMEIDHQNVITKLKTQSKQKKKKKSPKDPHITLTYKEYKSILKKLRKCESDKKLYKSKYMLAKKMLTTTAFNIVCKDMSPNTKLFCQMQASQSGKKKRGRRFTLDEKMLALSLYKPYPKAYRLLSNICVLPSRRTLQNMMHPECWRQ